MRAASLAVVDDGDAPAAPPEPEALAEAPEEGTTPEPAAEAAEPETPGRTPAPPELLAAVAEAVFATPELNTPEALEARAACVGKAASDLVPISRPLTETVWAEKEVVVDLVELEQVEQSWTVKKGLYCTGADPLRSVTPMV